MNERRRPPRRGRGKRPSSSTGAESADNPYLDDAEGGAGAETTVEQRSSEAVAEPAPRAERSTPAEVDAPPPPPPPPSDQGDGGAGRLNGTQGSRESGAVTGEFNRAEIS